MTVQVKADEFQLKLLFLQNVLSNLYLANIYLTPLLTNSWKKKNLCSSTPPPLPLSLEAAKPPTLLLLIFRGDLCQNTT